MNLLRKSSMTLLGAVAAGLLAFACADADGVAADSSEINAAAKRADTLVISQIYGGGGNSQSDKGGDYVELFNPTNETIDLAGYALQTQPKGKPAFNADKSSALKGKIEPGHYFLLGLSKDKKYGPDAKTADLELTGHDQDLIATAGAVAIVNTAKGEKLCAASCEEITDQVGYGSFNADVVALHILESAPKPPTKADAAFRVKSGCVDTEKEVDFEALPLNPRTSADEPTDCAKILAPAAEPDAGVDAAPETDGATNGDDAGDASAEPTEPKDGGADSGPKPTNPKPDASAPSTGGDEEEEDEPAAPTPEPTGGKKKKSSANAPPQPIAASSPSCSTTSGPASSGGLAGLAGLGLALAALGRRRKS